APRLPYTTVFRAAVAADWPCWHCSPGPGALAVHHRPAPGNPLITWWLRYRPALGSRNVSRETPQRSRPRLRGWCRMAMSADRHDVRGMFHVKHRQVPSRLPRRLFLHAGRVLLTVGLKAEN